MRPHRLASLRRALGRLGLTALALGGCSPAFYLTDYDVASYTRQFGTADLANGAMASWLGAEVIIDFDSTGRIASSNVRDVFRVRGLFLFTPEMMDRAGAQVERELDTWIGPEITSLVGNLGARLERLNQVRLDVLAPPAFAFNPGGQVINFDLRVRAKVSGTIFVPEADERYTVTLDVNDYQISGSLQFGQPHPQGTQVRLRARPIPGVISLFGNARREVVDRAIQMLAGPLSAPVDVTRTLSYEHFALPDLRFVQEPATGGLWTGLAAGPARRGETAWSYRTSEWARWVTYPDMRVLTGDFNGDGKTDVLKVDIPASGRRANGLWVGLSDGQQFDTSRWATWTTSQTLTVLTGDFNGDGKTDLLLHDPAQSGIWVGISDGRSFHFSRWSETHVSSAWQIVTGDFDGDGKTDVLIVEVPASGVRESALRVGLSDGRGRFQFGFTPWATWDTYRDMKILTGDFNGDGKTDVMKIDVPSSGTDQLGLWVGLSDGARFTTSEWARWDTYRDMKVLVGDFNGDGKTDVMKFDVPSAGVAALGLWVGLSDGARFSTSEWARWDTYRDMKVLAGDFNGDGKTDVMKFDVPSGGPSQLGLWVGLSNGIRFSTSEWGRWNTYRDMKVLAGDFNGDGRSDVMKLDVGGAPAPRLQSTYLARPEVPEPVLHVAVRAPRGRLYHGRRQQGAWVGFTAVTLGEGLLSDPSLVSAGQDRLDALAVSTTGQLLHASLRDGAWTEVPTAPLPAGVRLDNQRPAAATTAPGQLDVLAQSTDGRLLHFRRIDGRWEPALALTIPTVTATPPFRYPALAQAGNKLVLVFVDQQLRLIGMAFDLETARWGTAFGIPSPGVLHKPAAAACGDGRVEVAYVRRSDGALAHQTLQINLEVFRPGVASSGVFYSPAATVVRQFAVGGDPALACSGYRRLELLVPGSDRRIWHNHFTWSTGFTDDRTYTAGWQGWNAEGQPLVRSRVTPSRRMVGAVGAATSSAGHVHLVAREWEGAGNDRGRDTEPQEMWHNSYHADRWGRRPWATVHWRGWERAGGPAVLGLPALAVADRHADLVAVGADDGLWQAHVGNGIPARFTGGRAIAVTRYRAEPTAVASAPGIVDMLYVGSDDRLRHLRYLDAHVPRDVAVDPRPAIAAAIARPAAVAVGGQIELIALGSDRTLKHWRYRLGQWSGPETIPGSAGTTSAPALVNTGAGRLELFAVLGDQRVHHWRFTGAQWTPGRVLASDFPVRATVFGSLAASSWGDGTVDIVVADDRSGRMYHRHVGAGEVVPGVLRPSVASPRFVEIGGDAADVIALTALGPTRLSVLTAGAGGTVFAISSAPPQRVGPVLRIEDPTAPLVWRVDTVPGPRVVIAGVSAVGPAELLATGIDPAGRLYLSRFLDWRWTGFDLLPGQTSAVQHQPLVPPSLTGR